jgi:hypothetical protein
LPIALTDGEAPKRRGRPRKAATADGAETPKAPRRKAAVKTSARKAKPE